MKFTAALTIAFAVAAYAARPAQVGELARAPLGRVPAVSPRNAKSRTSAATAMLNVRMRVVLPISDGTSSDEGGNAGEEDGGDEDGNDEDAGDEDDEDAGNDSSNGK
ncbi:hypothetical protein PWT90_04946 [Aphanocladium album]|nr:hypothetical protein PWT90_04946 [Aphanocladium album]